MNKVIMVGVVALASIQCTHMAGQHAQANPEFSAISGRVNRTLHSILPPAGKALKSFKPSAVNFADWDALIDAVKKYVNDHDTGEFKLVPNDTFKKITQYNTYLKSLYTKGRVLGAGADLYTRMDADLAKLSELLSNQERSAREGNPSALSAVQAAQLLVIALQTASTQIMTYYDTLGIEKTLTAMQPIVKEGRQQPRRPLLSNDSQKRYEQLSVQIQEKSLNVFDAAQFNKVFMDVYQFAEEYGKEANADQAEELRRALTTLRAKSLSEEDRLQLELTIRGAWTRAREKKNKIEKKWFSSDAKAQAYELYALLWNKLLEGLRSKKLAGNV